MYSIDTSALIDGWVRYYPPDTFPALWERLADLVGNQSLYASMSVYEEIKKQEDRLLDWASEWHAMFLEDDEEIQGRVQDLLANWPRAVDFTRYLTGADPFVIALAQARGYTVITGEHLSNNPEAPKIPDACEHYGVPWTNFLGLVRREGWKF